MPHNPDSKKKNSPVCQVSERRKRDRFLDKLAAQGDVSARISGEVSGHIKRLSDEYDARLDEYGTRLDEYDSQLGGLDNNHEEPMDNEIKVHIDDAIKTHINDAMQTVLEMIDQKISTLEEHNVSDHKVPIIVESKDKKFEFYVGLGIGLSLFVGLIIGLFMRGIL